MRKLKPFVLGVALLALAVVPAGVGGNPQVNQFEFSGTFSDPDFCGTGMTVDGSFAGHGTEFLSPNQPVDYRNTSEGNVVYTNPLNGATVINHFAGPFSAKTISGDPAGLHTDELAFKGAPELLRAGGGGVLSRDAGYLIFHRTFDGDQFISNQIVLDRGPHPDAESEFAVFCDVMVPALGLG